MASPVGHSLGGWIFGDSSTNDWRWLLFIFFAASTPDLDFLVGALEGQFNRYHHMASHSLSAAVLFAAVTYFIAKRFNMDARRAAVVGGIVYLSHLLLDSVTIDSSAPRGMQLFWPFSQEYIIAPVTFFTNIQHGGKGDTLWEALYSIFSMHNFKAVILEVAILAPILIGVKWFKRKR